VGIESLHITVQQSAAVDGGQRHGYKC